MATTNDDYSTIEEATLAIGLGLVLLGTAVSGFFETVFGSPHTMEETTEAGDVVAHTSFDPHLRAYVVALGLVVLFAWAAYRFASDDRDRV